MDCSSNTIMCSTSFDKDDKILIKKEPCNEMSTVLQESPVPHNETYFEMVPEKNEFICDTEVDVKQEPWHLNETTIKGSEFQEPPILDLEPCTSTVVIKVEDNIKMGLKEETVWLDTLSTQESVSSTDTRSQNGEKESEPDKHGVANDILPVKSPRLLTEAVFSNGNSVTLLDKEKDGSSHKTLYGSNASLGNSMIQSNCSFDCSPTCDSDHFEFESEQNVADESTKAYKCEICGKCYRYKSSLRIHQMLHSGIKAHKCNICEKSFIRNSDLQSHALLHSGTKEYKCEYCSKYFAWKSNLMRHKLIHSGTKPHKCEICEKCFTRKSDLQSHSLLHSGLKPYKCDICDKCFTWRSDLHKHTLLHSGSKPYRCDICEKCFTQNSSLHSHKLLHLGTKPYKCDQCDKCFTQKSHLQRHTLLHSGKKSFKCDKCEKYFKQKSHLQSHILLHSGIKSYKCDICQKCFLRKYHLQRHTLRHSGKKNYTNVSDTGNVSQECSTTESCIVNSGPHI